MEPVFKIHGHDVHTYIMPFLTSNMFVIPLENEAIVVDPLESEEAISLLREKGIERVHIFLTHEHYDHISGVNRFREIFVCTVYAQQACAENLKSPHTNLAAFFDALMLDRTPEERQEAHDMFDHEYACSADECFTSLKELRIGDLQLRLVETPGHSKGSICIEVDEQYLFTGDSLVTGYKIVTRLPGGSKKLYQEITRPYLESFADAVLIFPGHGEVKTMGELRGQL